MISRPHCPVAVYETLRSQIDIQRQQQKLPSRKIGHPEQEARQAIERWPEQLAGSRNSSMSKINRRVPRAGAGKSLESAWMPYANIESEIPLLRRLAAEKDDSPEFSLRDDSDL